MATLLSCATTTRVGIERMSFSGPKLTKLNLTNLTLDTQNDIRSIPTRVVVAHESKVATVRLEKWKIVYPGTVYPGTAYPETVYLQDQPNLT